jgi:hypothetical protein
MKKLIFSALALVSLAIPIAICAQQPPIIDRQLFLGEYRLLARRSRQTGSTFPFSSPIRAREISGLRKRLIHSVRRVR